MSDTLEQVKAVVADKLGAEIGEITEDTRFQEDLEADSLGSRRAHYGARG